MLENGWVMIITLNPIDINDELGVILKIILTDDNGVIEEL
jgi:hypothetical protein